MNEADGTSNDRRPRPGGRPAPVARRMRRTRGNATVLCALASGLLTMALVAPASRAQPPERAAPTVVNGIYHWVHTTGDAERAYPFYRDVFGIELTRSPFASPPPENPPPPRIPPVAAARSDALVWNLTDTQGSRFRTAFMHAANVPFGLELSEFFDIARSTRTANPWDPGASTLIFEVRDLESVLKELHERGTPIVTLGGAPLDTPAGRAILVRDPDGYLIRVVQTSQHRTSGAISNNRLLGVSIGLCVANTAAALKFYRDLLGFDVRETHRATAAELRLNGLANGELVQTTTVIPGTAVTVIFSEFRLPASASPSADPFRWRIQDVGAPQFQLEVTGLDTLLARTKDAGYRLLSVGGRPIQRPFGRFVFAVDPDGILVEFVEPTSRR